LPGLKRQEKRGWFNLAGWAEAALGLVFPNRCLFCAAVLPPGAGEPLCRDCRPGFSSAGLICPQCEQHCGRPEACACATAGPPLQGLFALSWYEGEWRRMLHRLKYQGRRQLARPLGKWLGTALAGRVSWPLEIVVPVPLHRRREAERGFNQSLLIARHAAGALGLPLVFLLEKTRHTPSQTGFSRGDRIKNISGAFSFAGPDPRYKTALLIDDIYSTGATLKEAGAVLGRRGLTVYGAVAAYNRLLLGQAAPQ
jgi:ComF family protein